MECVLTTIAMLNVLDVHFTSSCCTIDKIIIGQFQCYIFIFWQLRIILTIQCHWYSKCWINFYSAANDSNSNGGKQNVHIYIPLWLKLFHIINSMNKCVCTWLLMIMKSNFKSNLDWNWIYVYCYSWLNPSTI